MQAEPEEKLFTQSLADLGNLPRYQRTNSKPSKKEWIEREYELLHELIDVKKYPYSKVSELVNNSITPQTLAKWYRVVTKERKAQAKAQQDSTAPATTAALKAAQKAAQKAARDARAKPKAVGAPLDQIEARIED